LAMPDIHWGYGFPIGGVAAMRVDDGVISPGGVGFDINCGVRLLRTNLMKDDVSPKIKPLMDALYNSVPSGVGSKGRIRLKGGEVNEVLKKGSRWAVEHGYGRPDDLESTEENGEMAGADPSTVSGRAKERGTPQLGTLGSGNHFLEVAIIDEIHEPEIARAMGINELGQVMLYVHCGSRGLGHQVADDYIKEMVRAMVKYGVDLPDRQLACSPVKSPEGQAYLAAMGCAANYAWANRQVLAHRVRRILDDVLAGVVKDRELTLVYDLTHNIAKVEEHTIDGKSTKLVIHRKGATRAFGPGMKGLPADYREVGQPVLIPGNMGTASYVLAGTAKAMEKTFGTSCHGAGRVMSRRAAKRKIRGQELQRELAEKGIIVRGGSMAGLAEEAPAAYK
ncbi:MAG: RtcB family protein, partial [Planctomycetes bacterium]|nr:RtcB family protein [Planctomycetota bacterium]